MSWIVHATECLPYSVIPLCRFAILYGYYAAKFVRIVNRLK